MFSQGMDVFQNVDITNCEIPTLPSRAFSNFGTVNFFGIQGGKIDLVQGNAFTGLTVRRDPDSVSPKGEFMMMIVNDLLDSVRSFNWFNNSHRLCRIRLSNF